MIDPTLLLFIVIVAVVLLTSLFKLPLFSHKVKVAIATAVSVLGAAVHVWVTGEPDTTDFIATALQVFGGSQLIYNFILDNTKLDDALEHVGVKTDYDES
jgi:hypothetical protein